MPYAIVFLDLKGFSDLSPDGARAVFSEFLPKVRETLGKPEDVRLLDVNTWGDAVVAAFEKTKDAAQFALDVRHLLVRAGWKNPELCKLKVRIAIHVADVERGIDVIRALPLKARERHVYGAGMTLPARIEPVVTPNNIWVTWDASLQVQTAIDTEGLGAKLFDLGFMKIPRIDQPRKIFWLGNTTDAPPAGGLEPPAAQKATLARLTALRALNELAEQFHIFAQTCTSAGELFTAFQNYHHLCLLVLRKRQQTAETLQAHVLQLRQDGRLEHDDTLPPTDTELRDWVADMKLRCDKHGKLVRPSVKDGIATYCVWANLAEQPGVVIADDVHKNGDAQYFFSDSDKTRPTEWYQTKNVPDMYRPSAKRERPPFRSMLSAAIIRITDAGKRPDLAHRRTCVGVLNLTSSRPYSFNPEDCAWAESAASILGSLYESYLSRKERLVPALPAPAAVRQPKRTRGRARG